MQIVCSISQDGIAPAILGYNKQYYPHFREAKLEVHRGKMTCLSFQGKSVLGMVRQLFLLQPITFRKIKFFIPFSWLLFLVKSKSSNLDT